MSAARSFPWSLQAKVLVVVLTFLVVVPACTLWVVNRHVSRQVQDEARQTLVTAEAVFRQSLDIRARDLLLRYRNVVNEPRFKAIVQLDDGKTMTGYLRDLLEEFGGDNEVILFMREDGEVLGSARRDANLPVETFAKAARAAVDVAFEGGRGLTTVSFNNRIYNVIAVPATVREGGPLTGALAIGVRLGESAVQEMKTLTRAEIVLLADKRVAASTLVVDDAVEALANARTEPAEAALSTARSVVQEVVIDDEHFLALAAGVESSPGFHYVLLSSYEQRLQSLARTQRTLLLVSGAGILVGSLVVWFFVRRITRPLRELRDMAEAVGQGDFSRKVERFSNDECGEVAEAFNRMTGNLQSSRAELQTAVDTLKNTQAQLVQSEKLSAVGQFVAGVAHELNNPLTAVIGFADLLKETVTDKEIRPQIDLIARSGQRCQKIVQSLLSFSRQQAPERKLLKLGALIDDILEIMAYDLRTSGVEVLREYGEIDVNARIVGDAHQLQQVFVNLLNNARQALHDFRRDGRIAVRAFVAGSMARLEFQDNGPGIKPEHFAKIFDPFFTTKAVGKGTGLGLSLVYGIIQEHGGKIRVQSEPGQGAVFVIELPLATASQQSSVKLQSGQSRPPMLVTQEKKAGAGRSVLVVDDEEWILSLTEELLRREGYDVVAVLSCERALEVLGGRRFDVIVSDWKMPGLNGIQFYEHLRAHDPESAQRLLFMTGDVMSETFERFLERNAKTYLSKPFAIEDFRAAVAALLGDSK
jgi:two-component system, NtrC family, sensor kinase